MVDIAEIAQLGGLGLFALYLLRHTLAQSNKLATMMDNHLHAELDTLIEIKVALQEINLHLSGRR